MSHLKNEEDTIYVPNLEGFSTTWHGLETLVEKILPDGSNVPDVFHEIIECGIKPVFEGKEVEINDEFSKAMSRWKLVAANLLNHKAGKIVPINVPKKGYAIVQNREFFDQIVKALTEVLGGNGFDIVSLGTLNSYGEFFGSIKIKGESDFQISKSDIWKKLFNFNTSHSGLLDLHFLMSLIRSVCFNTVSLAIENAQGTDEIESVRHTAEAIKKINAKFISAKLKSWIDGSEEFKANLEAIRSIPMNSEGFKSFASGVFTSENSDKLSTISFNRINEMESLFVRGRGNKGESVYDAINAFTEFFTSGNGVGKKSTPEKRFASANFGRGNDWKREAFRVASNETSFASCMARGEILLHDRLLVEASKN